MEKLLCAPNEWTEQKADRLAGKYLTFSLHGEFYGIGVLKVREIIRHHTITVVPQMPPHILGVINLRGKVIPVMDLRQRFGFPNAVKNEHACIVVVQTILLAGNTASVGMMVDSVEEVVNFDADDIEQPPELGVRMAANYILGMAKVKGTVKVLLDVDRVVGAVGG